MADRIEAEYIDSTHSSWHPNDFVVGEKYVALDRVFTVVGKNEEHQHEFSLDVTWDDGNVGAARVYPNLQWVAMNWEVKSDGS